MSQPFDAAVKRLDKYIWAMAHKFKTSVRGMDEHDLHQEGLIVLYGIHSSALYTGKSTDDLDAIFKAALYNAFADLYQRGKKEKARLSDDVDVETCDWSVDAFNSTHLAHFQEHLAKFLSADAAKLLDTLLHPTPPVYHLHLIQRMRRQAVHSQGVMSCKIPTKITQATVGQALGFTTSKTKGLARELQQVWRDHGCKYNLTHNSAMS
jgi:hypothetical protein